MRKAFALFLFLVSFSIHATTITGDPSTLLGYDASNSPVTITGYDLPQVYQGKTYLNVKQLAQLTNGILNVTIKPPGRYDLNFAYGSATLRIINPPSDDTYDISEFLTNIVVFTQRNISSQVLPGSGISIVTNNPGPRETITISSTNNGGNGGNATNAYTLELSGTGLNLSTDALNYIYTLSLNANLQAWGALATSAKQDASANLTSWAALAPSAKQDHSANLDAWSGLATSAKQNALGFTPEQQSANLDAWSALAPSAKQTHTSALDFWAGETVDGTTIVNSGGVLSAVTSGSGNVTGATSSTDSEIPLFSLTTGKALKGSGHFLSDYQLSLGFAPTSFQNVTDVVNSVTLPLDALATAGQTNIAGVDAGTNLTKITIGARLSLASGVLSADVQSGNGSASALTQTNFYIRDTNAIVLDFAQAQTFNAGSLTNGILVLSNAVTITNLACHDVALTVHQWTNGAARLLALKNAQGNLTTNGTYVQTTNGNATDLLVFRLADRTGTNLVLSAITNCSTYADTNSLLAGGGGGGGGGGWTLVGTANGDTFDAAGCNSSAHPLNATGANLLVAAISFSGGSPPDFFTNAAVANNWTLTTGESSTPRIIYSYVINPNVNSSMVFTNPLLSGNKYAFQVYAFTKSAGTPVIGTEEVTNYFNWQSAGSPAGTVLMGSQTPDTANDLFISGITWDTDGTTTLSVDSSFTALTKIPITSGGIFGMNSASKIKASDSSAENPGWSWSSSTPFSTVSGDNIHFH